MFKIDFNEFYSYFKNVDFGNVFSVILGAVIASFFSRFIERMKLKKDIQIKTSEIITQAISVIVDNTSKLEREIEYLSLTICIESDCKNLDLTPLDSVDHFKELTDNKYYYSSNVQQIVDVYESTKQFKNKYSEYLNSIEDLKNKLKVRRVILKQLNCFDNIILRQDTIEKIQFEFIFYYEELYRICKEDNNIKHKDLDEKFMRFKNLFKAKIIDLSDSLEQFTNELQKEFLGDLFK